MQAEITDPSREMSEVCTALLEQPPRDTPTIEVLAGLFELASTDTDLIEILGAIRRRLDRLDDFARKLEDPDFDDEQRSAIRAAIANLVRVLSPGNFHVSWKNAHAALQQGNLIAFRWFSPTAKKHRPLSRLSDETREEIIQELVETAAQLEASDEISGFHREALLEGLRHLTLMMRHVRFFGHQAVQREVANLQVLTVAAMATLPANADAPRPPTLGRLIDIAGRISLAMSLFAGVDQVMTALDRYENWPRLLAKYALESTPFESLPTPQDPLILPSPATVSRKSPGPKEAE